LTIAPQPVIFLRFKQCAVGEPEPLRSWALPANLDIIDASRDNERRFGAMKIRPLQDRVIVKRIAEEEKTKGGIIIPDTAKEKPQEGKIIAVGKGKLNDEGKVVPLDVKVGDKILFGKYSGSEIKLDGEEHLIMREEDILGVIEG
jgi:chaperonin GroES